MIKRRISLSSAVLILVSVVYVLYVCFRQYRAFYSLQYALFDLSNYH